jgi:hypothetical protein
MKFNRQRLTQLLSLAGSAPPAENPPLPFSLQARILTAWRTARLAQERLELSNVFRLLRLFRLGLGVACALTLLVVAFSLHHLRRDPLYELASPVPVMNLALKP